MSKRDVFRKQRCVSLICEGFTLGQFMTMSSVWALMYEFLLTEEKTKYIYIVSHVKELKNDSSFK